ncbi:MAG: MBG domain-containing protein [Mucilaginibacter sp.]
MIKNLPIKIYLLCCFNFVAITAFAQLPVKATHPRIFLDATTKTSLLAKKNANTTEWKALLADANKYLPKQVIPWNEVTASSNQYYNTGDIFYSYCGSNWEVAAMTIGLAHQLTKKNNSGANPTAYSAKLLQFADVIIKAYADYPPNKNYKPNIFQFNSSYATRHVGKTIAVIYDWCYDELGETRKAALRNVMVSWYKYMKTTPYGLNQLQTDPTGNYFVGHLVCAGYMGYAIGSDDPTSKKMIEFARQRLTGAPGVSINHNTSTSAESAINYFTQSVKGGLPIGAATTYLGPKNITGAPQNDGIPVQGWSYGGETTNFLIDYCYAVKSATGEDLIVTENHLKRFFAKTSEAMVHAYFPNRFQYDNSNDNGSFLGCTANYALPLRLSAILAGTPEGANIEYWYKNLQRPVNLLTGNKGYPALSWEKLLYGNNRTATAATFKPYYPQVTVNIYTATAVNKGLQKFYMRENWTKLSTWAALEMGTAAYDQHNHNNAGHFKIVRGDSHDGDDHLLVGANEIGNGGNGIDGSSNYAFASSQSNTLFIDDYDDYDARSQDHANTTGGQTSYGYDVPTHQEQNDNFSYFRSDLTSAYYVAYTDPDTSQRSLKYYYRSFLYLRGANIFLVYDNLLAKNSTNALGQYKKHLRWHFLRQPAVNGNNVTATMDNSKLFVHTVLPATVNIAAVNEITNPDNVYGSGLNYYFNTPTWRAEVNVPGNPLKQDILTVLQPGAKTGSTEMTTTAIKTLENNMEGSIVKVNGRTEVVLFNNSVAKYPLPVVIATYTYMGAANATHSLCGLDPAKNYQLTYKGATVTLKRTSTGTLKPSPSGVLTFVLPAPVKVAQTIKFSATRSLKYGTADTAPGATSDNPVIPITYTSSNSAIATIVNGQLHIKRAGVTTITASQAGSVYFDAASLAQTLTVTPVALKIAAPEKTKAYGSANPVLKPVYTGFVNGDTSIATPPVLATIATIASVPGVYPVTASGAASVNYTFTYVPGKLTVSKAPLTITANNLSKVQGAANPILTVSYSGFVNGQTAAVLTTLPIATTAATASSPVGSYVINVAGAVAANYAPVYVPGTLTVTAPASAKMASIAETNGTETEVTVQQALSPNGDGINDVLSIAGLNNYADNKVVIMNTAGALIYQAAGYDNVIKVFKGYNKNGTLQKPGIYFYLVEYKTGTGIKRKTGYFVLKY